MCRGGNEWGEAGTRLSSVCVTSRPPTSSRPVPSSPLHVSECIDEFGGVPGLLLAVLEACDTDTRQLVAGHVVICGGGATLPGLPNAVCVRATQLALDESPSHSPWSLGPVIARLPSREITVAPTPFARSSLHWIGGSLFAAVKANDEKYVRLEEYRATAQLLRQQLEQQKVTEQDQAAMRPWSPEGGGGRPRVPDWMSLDDALRYRFFGSPLVSASSVVLGGLGVGRG
eukprot:gene384-401_t